MRSRVTPGVSWTTAARRPRKRLTSVDLPTLGRPTIATTGSGPVCSLMRPPRRRSSNARAALLCPCVSSRARSRARPDGAEGQLDDPVDDALAVEVGAVDDDGVLGRAQRAVGAAAVVLVAAAQVGGELGDLVRRAEAQLRRPALGTGL